MQIQGKFRIAMSIQPLTSRLLRCTLTRNILFSDIIHEQSYI